MAEARPRNSTREVSESATTSSEKSRKGPTGAGHGGKAVRLLNLQQARDELGLTIYAIYEAVDRDELEPLQREGGRIYYSERQLRALLRRLTKSYSIAA